MKIKYNAQTYAVRWANWVSKSYLTDRSECESHDESRDECGWKIY